MTDLRAFIKEGRKLRGLTQGELAQLAHISRVSLSHYETGRQGLTADAIEALLSALGARLVLSHDGQVTTDLSCASNAK